MKYSLWQHAETHLNAFIRDKQRNIAQVLGSGCQWKLYVGIVLDQVDRC
jgi:hypothetical protein